MKTIHHVFYQDSRDSVKRDLALPVGMVLTSPPYPMIEMWDSAFSEMNPEISTHLRLGKGDEAFKLMHLELDKVWAECYEKLIPGGIACINIGDATRNIDDNFKLYPNHAHILNDATNLGFQALPEILWRKQSNKPTKFMGSGTLPAGAYVTQEHEHVLVLRKGGKRLFTSKSDKENRQKSAFFWEERNTWFSDMWEGLKGDRQGLNHEGLRNRSAAYPFDLAYRLISMFSVRGDTVLDPFLGTGTTLVASIALARNSAGFEITQEFRQLIESRIEGLADFINEYNRSRLRTHLDFIKGRAEVPEHKNEVYQFPVVSGQETLLEVPLLESVELTGDGSIEAKYSDEPIRLLDA